jgi:putative hemolysin
MLLEIALVLVLILVNGLLAMSELAIVSSRPARLRARAERGEAGARVALRLSESPGRFLSTVQIGITLVGVLAGAFSGATVGARLANLLPQLGLPRALAEEVGVGIVVLAITYLSLVIGELVPKQIALSEPERVAVRVAPAMQLLSRIAAPIVWLLDRSGKLVLRLLGRSGRRPSAVSDEDIRMLLSEAAGAGVIHKREKELIGGVMRLADRRARGLMTPRHEVEIAEVGETRAQILERFRRSGHTRLPLRRGGPDDIVGALHSRDLLAATDAAFDARALERPAPVVIDTLPALDVIERLRTAPSQMLLVYDEYGHFEGIVTPMDILGAIAGGFDEAAADEPLLVEREDGSLLVAGRMPMDELAERLGLALEDGTGSVTVAGLVLDRMGTLPAEGQHVDVGDWRFEVVDMDGWRIDELLVRKEPPRAEGGPPGSLSRAERE